MKVKEQDEEIHIATGFDKNYVVYIYAMLASIFYNNKEEKIVFHVITTTDNETGRSELIEYIEANNAKIIYYKLNEDYLNDKITIPQGSYFTAATYYRLFFVSLIDSRIKKLFYLDADLIVLGSLRAFYQIDIGNFAVAAVSDPYIERNEDLGVLNKGDYFNAGVMLINTDNWKQQQISERALKFAKDNPEKVNFCDQDALNATLKGEWLKLSNKYNLTQFDVHLQMPAKDLIKDVLIVHFTSNNKPWVSLSRNKLRFLYYRYLKMSPMRNQKRYADFKWDLRSLWTFTRIRTKEFYFNHKINKMFPIKKWEDPSWNY